MQSVNAGQDVSLERRFCIGVIRALDGDGGIRLPSCLRHEATRRAFGACGLPVPGVKKALYSFRRMGHHYTEVGLRIIEIRFLTACMPRCDRKKGPS